jgi:serine/threonine protein kinase
MLLFSVYLIINLKVPDDNIFDYTLGESLGKGSFGKVVACTKNDKTFAMKIQKKEDNEFYEEEIRVLQAINGQKNCVEMISTFENDTLHFIVFEKL